MHLVSSAHNALHKGLRFLFTFRSLPPLKGEIYVAERRSIALLRAEFPAWRGGLVPAIQGNGHPKPGQCIRLAGPVRPPVDHGDNQGVRGLWNKSTLYREATNIPMIMAGPGVLPGRVCTTNVNLVDLAPTVLDAVGVEAPPSGPAARCCELPAKTMTRCASASANTTPWDRPARPTWCDRGAGSTTIMLATNPSCSTSRQTRVKPSIWLPILLAQPLWRIWSPCCERDWTQRQWTVAPRTIRTRWWRGLEGAKPHFSSARKARHLRHRVESGSRLARFTPFRTVTRGFPAPRERVTDLLTEYPSLAIEAENSG